MPTDEKIHPYYSDTVIPVARHHQCPGPMVWRWQLAFGAGHDVWLGDGLGDDSILDLNSCGFGSADSLVDHCHQKRGTPFQQAQKCFGNSQ